jgi:hypothetical protein
MTDDSLMRSSLLEKTCYRFAGQVYFCPYDKCADAVRVFGFGPNDLPVAVIDDTKGGQKFIHDKHKEKRPFSSKSIEKFWKDSLAKIK